MSAHRRALLVFAGLVLMAACRRRERVVGPVAAELVTLHGGGLAHAWWGPGLRVHTSPPFEELLRSYDTDTRAIDCSHVELAEDPAGKFIAFRCTRQTRWWVIRLLGGNRHLVECDAPVGTANPPDFSKLGTLQDAAERILDCADRREVDFEAAWVDLVHAVEKREGEAAAVALVLEMGKRANDEGARKFWEYGVDALSPPARAKLTGAVCAALGGTTDYLLYRRAVDRCDLDAPPVADGALAIFRDVLSMRGDASETLEEPLDGGTVRKWTREQTGAVLEGLRWAAPIAAARRPKEAGAAACASLPTLPFDDRRELAIGVLAASGKPCPTARVELEVATKIDARRCYSGAFCGGHRCTAAEIDADLAKWMAKTHGTAVRLKDPKPIPNERAALRALYALGDVPPCAPP